MTAIGAILNTKDLLNQAIVKGLRYMPTPVMIKFYMVVGRDEAYENAIRSVVTEVREKFKGGEREKVINATFIRIKPEAVDAALNALSMPEGQVPQNLVYLVKSMKQDGVTALPALIINGRKIYEGQLPPPDVIKQVIVDEVMSVLLPTQAPQPQLTQATQQAPQQAPPPPPPQAPPQPSTPQPVRPPTPPPIEVKQQVEPVKPEVETVSVRQAPVISTVPVSSPSGVRIVVGRPDDCRDCIYYGANTGTCLLFGYRVTDPTRPPCKSA